MLDINPALMVIIAVIFLAVIARLNTCLYQPLLKHMDDRDADIKKKLASAEQNSSDIQTYYDEANRILAEAKKQASAIRQSAISEATAVGEAKLNEAKKEIETKYLAFLQQLDDEKAKLKATLVQNASMFKETLTNKLKSI
jgi:F-type H+-transporting ATPase subunit b